MSDNAPPTPEKSSNWRLLLILAATGIGLVAATAAVVFLFMNYVIVARTNRDRRELMIFGLRYHEFAEVNNRTPASLDDMLKNAAPDGFGVNGTLDKECPRTVEGIRTGRILVVWNARRFTAEENGKFILAHEAGAHERGGLVLLLDGLVRRWPPEEIRNYKMAPIEAPASNE